MSQTTEQTWLKSAAVFIIVTSSIFFMAPFWGLGIVMTIFTDIVFWPFDGSQDYTGQPLDLVSVIGAGLMAGMGWAIYKLADEGLEIAPELARKTITQVIWIWFTIDSLGSVLVGAPLNVLGNTIFLALVLVPIAKAKRATP